MSEVAPDLLVRLLIDQSERWNRGQSLSIESYLEQHPSLRNDETILDLISNEIYVRCSRGETPTLADYRDRFPHLAEQVELQLQLHKSAGTAKNGALWRSAASFPERRTISAADLRPIIPGYELIEELGRGAMGVVYKARQTSLRRVVALKVTHIGGADRQTLQARFRVEAEAVARLQHTNIVQIFEVGEYEDSSYISLELVGGGSLAQRLKGEPLTEPEAAQCVLILARAMHYAHRRGVVHRDLKPANILLTPGGTPKITDFGLARQMKDSRRLTRIGDILGTPSYMAPEQANGDPETGATADVYSLGVILYELLTGKPPFTGESAWATLLMVGYTLPDPPSRIRPGVPPDLDAICLKCLQKNPQERYASAKALADDLERFQRGRTVKARPITFRRRIAIGVRRSLARLGIALAVLIALAVILARRPPYWSALWQRNHLPVIAEQVETSFHPEKKIDNRSREGSGKSIVQVEDDQDAPCILEAERYAARESLKAAELERDAARKAQVDAEKQQREAGNRLDQVRREHYAQQLLDISAVWQRDPARARQLLNDTTRCPLDLRDFTWGLFANCCDRPRVIFPVQSKNVLAVAVSSDGKIASAGADGSVRLLDQSGKEQKVLLEHKDQVFALRFAPDGKHFATGGADKSVRLWSKSGELRHTLTGHKGKIYAVAYTPDGKILASADEKGEIRIWETATGKERNSFQAQKVPPKMAAIRSLAFSLDGKSLISAGDDGIIRSWNWNEKKSPLSGGLLGSDGPIYSISFSPDGKTMASAGMDGFARLWNVENNIATAKHILPCLAGRVNSVAFSPDGKVLGCGEEGIGPDESSASVKLWDTVSGQPLTTFPSRSSVYSLAFLNDSKRLVVAAGRGVEIWQISRVLEQSAYRADDKPLLAVAVAHDGRTLASGGQDQSIKLMDIETGSIRQTLKGHTGQVKALAFRPGDNVLASGSADGSLRLWDTVSGKPNTNIEAHKDGVACVAFSSDGGILASAGGDHLVKLWNPRTGELINSLTGHGATVTSLAISRIDKVLASGSSDGILKLWDSSTGELLRSILLPGGDINSLAFLADGLTLIAACQDGSVRLVDSTSGRIKQSLPTQNGPVLSLALSPDGKTLAAAGSSKAGKDLRGEVRLWDPVAGQLRAVLTGNARDVTGVAFSADGRRLVSTSLEGTVKVWEAVGR